MTISYTKSQKIKSNKKSFNNYLLNCFSSTKNFNDFAEAAHLKEDDKMFKLFNDPNTQVFQTGKLINHTTDIFHEDVLKALASEDPEGYVMNDIILSPFTHHNLPCAIGVTVCLDETYQHSYSVWYSIYGAGGKSIRRPNSPWDCLDLCYFYQKITPDLQEKINNFKLLT